MAVSGTSAIAAGFAFGAVPALTVGIAIVWGVTVVADSAQFSTAVSELAQAGTAGSALALQMALGFLLTGLTILAVGWLDPGDGSGWRVAFTLLALGPAIGWKDEGVRSARERDIGGMQIIYNMLEQDPGRAHIAACEERGVGVVVRVPHSSGMLEGKYTEDTVFAENDHRRHRPRSWLINGIKKVEQLQFLVEARPGATLGQLALKWLFAHPAIASALPNIYDRDQLAEFAAACEVADLTPDELARERQKMARRTGTQPSPKRARSIKVKTSP